MKTYTNPITNVEIEYVKSFLLSVGKKIYDNGKRIYYVDFNGKSHKLGYISWA